MFKSETGKRYIMRNGKITKVLTFYEETGHLSDGVDTTWSSTGAYDRSKPTEFDLVAVYEEKDDEL